MAVLASGYTFSATETVTAAKLAALVNNGTCAGIATADISNSAITDAKINDVSGAKFTNLSSIPAGEIPAANLGLTLSLIYPIGTIYSNKTNSTNPGTLFGFGTWTAIEGYVVAGYKSGDTNFGTAGATVGVATVTLTAAQSGSPAHTHTGGAHTHGILLGTADGQVAQANDSSGDGAGGTETSGSGGAVETSANSAANASEAHSNIQPTLVAYVWERTA